MTSQFQKALIVVNENRVKAGEMTKTVVDGVTKYKLTAKGAKAFRKRADAILNETPAQERKATRKVSRWMESL